MRNHACALALLCFALPVAAQSPTYGGTESGCIDVGGVSVITTDAQTGSGDAEAIFRNHHPGYDPECTIWMTPTGTGVYHIRVFNCGPCGPGWPWTETLDQTWMGNPDWILAGRGCTRSWYVLPQEFIHHWVANNIPRPLLESGIAEGASETGVLRDDSADFSSVLPGDHLFFPDVFPIGRNFEVTTVGSDGKSLTFAEFVEWDGSLFPYAPPAGTRYEARSVDLTGRQWAHWNRFAQADGSWFDGNEWRDNGDGTFTVVGAEYRLNDWDLYMMGLKPREELRPMWTIKNADDPASPPPWINANTVRGVKRTYSVEQILEATAPQEGSGLQSLDFQPRAIRTRFILWTTLGNPVPAEMVERIDQFRRDWGTEFQRETAGPGGETRGRLITVTDTEKPDLVISELSCATRLSSGDTVEARALIHNQTETAAGAFDVTLRLRPGSWTILSRVSLSGLGPHEMREVVLPFTVPSAFSVFGYRTYQGSFSVEVTVDPYQRVVEAEELRNSRRIEVTWVPSVGLDLEGEGRIVDGPVTDGVKAYVLRRNEEGSRFWIEELSLNDPRDLKVVRSIELGTRASCLAARPGLLAVGAWNLWASKPEVRLYRLPLSTGASPARVLTIPESGGWTVPRDLVFNGDFLYMSPSTGGPAVVEGLASPESARVATMVPFIGWINRLIVHEGRLLCASSEGLIEYDIADPRTPVRRPDLATIPANGYSIVAKDACVIGGTLYGLFANGRLVAVDLASKQVLSTTRLNLRMGWARSLARAGNFLLVQSTDASSLVLSASGGSVTSAGEYFGTAKVAEDVFAPVRRSAEFRGWLLFSDDHGARAFSPTGVTDRFVRGDANGDGSVTAADITEITNVLFLGGTFAGRHDAFDVNDDGAVDISDVVFLSSWIYQGGSPPRSPFPGAGTDPTPDALRYVKPR
ncbi:MAG: APHP domain-containing [Planctomycetota bacterium]|nr:MAG: APHP domain-containing [Planctomycetota bacterium]